MFHTGIQYINPDLTEHSVINFNPCQYKIPNTPEHAQSTQIPINTKHAILPKHIINFSGIQKSGAKSSGSGSGSGIQPFPPGKNPAAPRS